MKDFFMSKNKSKVFVSLCAVILSILGIVGITHFSAEEDTSPSHAKTLTDNGDGTYQIALDVTGDSNPEIETSADVNVVIVYDVSQSMTNRVNGNSGPRRADAAENVVHDFLVDLAGFQNEEKSNIQVSLVRFSVNGNQLSGWTNNINTNNNSLANMFGDGGQYGDAKLSYSNMGNQNMGTNWEHPLRLAQTLIQNKPLDGPTFVIMITDGAPTKSGTSTSMGDNPSSPWYDLREHYNSATDEARAIETIGDDTPNDNSDDATLYGIYASFGGNEADLLDDLLYYANTGNHRAVGGSNIMSNPRPNHNYGDTEEASNYYNASETSILESAIEEILGKVIQAMGVSSVNISDGTTSSVKASTGTVHLLNIDQSSYKYWLSMDLIPVSGQANTYINNETGNTITFVGDENSATGTWTDKSGQHTIEGKILTITDPNDDTKTKTIFRMQWTDEGNALHSEAPTAAQLVTDADGNESVDWDLSSHGVLLNGVTYTVTFDVWPTQYTYDLIADLENGTVEYTDLHEGADSDYAGLDEYITKSLSGDYYLETNTTATLSYKDTRLENPTTEYATYTNPPAEKLDVDKIDVIKKWENDYDSATGNAIQIIVNRETGDEKDEFYRANLNVGNDYTVNDINIATGLMRLNRETGEVSVLDSGHDYSFEEINGQHYKWEFVAQTVHPMLINGELHELILLDEAATQVYTVDDALETYTMPDMADDEDYYADDEYEYVRIDGKIYVITDATPTIKAFNYRRSNLNLNKVVEGKAANPDELFEFTIDVDDPGLEADEKLWFSIFDENDEVIIDENLPVSDDWTAEYIDGAPTGFYYANPGTTLVVSLKVGQNLRFTNLTTQATYTIVETGKENYVLTDATGKGEYGSELEGFDYTDYEVDTNTRTITGDITKTNSTFSITVTNTYELASIDITKKWDDNNDQDGKRPDEIELQVYRQIGENGTPEAYGKPVIISKDAATDDNTWKATIESVNVTSGDTTKEENLPRYDADGNEYLYTVEEIEIDGYDTEYDPEGVNQEDGKASYTITNKHIPELYNKNGKLKVTKHWDDADNQDGLRENVEIELIINGEPSGKTITLDTTQDNSAEFTDLPMYEDGVAIEYTITENTTLTGYFDPEYDMDTPGDFTVTNKHIPELYNKNGKLKVTKHWDDNDNQDGLRENVEIELIINGEPSGKTITLDTTQDNSAEFTDLPMYEDGVAIEYTITENTTLTGYFDPDYDMDTPGDFTVTNKHIPELYNKNGKLKVTKHWDDNDNQDGLRENVEIELLINGEESGMTMQLTTDQDNSDEFTDLPMYEDGVAIEYTIVENTALTGYEDPDYDMDTPGDFTVTNKHVPELYNKNGKLKVTKHWDDADNQDGLRENVEIELIVNGEPSGKTITLDTTQDNSAEFTDLPMYEDGVAIEYTIAENTDLTGYEDPDYDMDTPGDFTVTNKHVPELYNKNGKLKVTKHWDDNDNYDGLRENVEIELIVNGEPSGKTITLDTTQDNSAEFTDLPMYEDGVAIEYTIAENTDLTGYEDPEYDMDTPGDFTVTNKHDVVSVSIDVTKQWVDDDDQDGKRKDEITVKIFANGEFLRNETIKGDKTKDTWTYTIQGLDKYKDGDEIEYTLEEVQVEDYEKPVITGDAENGFTIVNTHNASKISKTVKKTWNHGDNQFDKPTSITVILHAKVGDTELDTVRKEITATDNWEYTFADLDEYKDGNIIVYWIDEAPVTDYTANIEASDDVTTIKNTYNPATFNINGTKTWDDSNNQDGKRPDHITVTLHGSVDGQELEDLKQTKDVYEKNGKWEYTFENVLKYAGGVEVEYSIEESPVDEYDEPIIHGTADEGFSITNHHTPETISYIVTKNWEDYNNADEIRPDSITVSLYKIVDNVRSFVEDFEISAANNWTYRFESLPRYEGGKEITYDIVEDVVAGYTPFYSTESSTGDDGRQNYNATIANYQTIDISVEKIWKDENDYDRIRPNYIDVKLYANGRYVKTFRISRENNWKYVLEGLLKYEDGVEIIYTIEEEAIEGYITTIDGYTIINTHEVKKDKYYVEEMPPKTGVNGTDTNYLLLLLITIVCSCKMTFGKVKNIFAKTA